MIFLLTKGKVSHVCLGNGIPKWDGYLHAEVTAVSAFELTENVICFSYLERETSQQL